MSQPAMNNRRRNKTILSCTFCRGRKLRCDRLSPCGACERRGEPADCVYTCSEQERKDAIDYRPHARTQKARQRITRLESLVNEMRNRVQNSQPYSGNISLPSEHLSNMDTSLPPTGSHTMDDVGKLSLTDDHAVYTGSSHWETILENIQQLKDELSEEDLSSVTSPQDTPSNIDPMHGTSVSRISLLNSAPCFSREQILAMIPPRRTVDRYISQFFNNFDMAPFIFHRQNFLSEYAEFWSSPSTTPIMWIGLLFSILSMSIFLQHQDVGVVGLSTAESQNLLETYRTLTIHCLLAGDYLRPSRYTIETLTLHFAVDQNVNLDTPIGNWILIGVVIRIALRMGLHRDPSHWPNIRPLQAELRRRIWIMLYQMDFFTSTQVGLPRIINDSQCDTRPPAHLHEHDIDFEQQEMPPERPLTEYTPLLFIIQRDAIIRVAAEIYDATEAGPPSATIIAALGAKLDRAVGDIPESLRYKSLESSIAESPVVVLNRMFLDILKHKAIYLLHRRSFVRSHVVESDMSSDALCINAALSILEHQRRLNEESQPGGLLFSIRWKVTTSLNHEFLQATMMLCFALSRSKDTAGSVRPVYKQEEVREALKTAKGLWENIADQSAEARRAARAITAVMDHDMNRSGAPVNTILDGFHDEMPAMNAQSYSGGFEFAHQSNATESSFFATSDDLAAFTSMLDDFVVEENHPWAL